MEKYRNRGPATLIVHRLPADYRWATALEAEMWDTLYCDSIQVVVGYDNDIAMTDIAVPAVYPALDEIMEEVPC